MYNHFEYGKYLAGKLIDITEAFDASSQSDPQSMDEKITRINGGVFVSVDSKDGMINYSGSECMSLGSAYIFLVLFPVASGNSEAEKQVLEKAKAIAKQIVKKMMLDFESNLSGLEELDPSSFEIHGVGPLGECHHGVAIVFEVGESFGFKLDPTMWRE